MCQSCGNETEIIIVDGEEIGFLAKYFGTEIDGNLIRLHLRTFVSHISLTHIIHL